MPVSDGRPAGLGFARAAVRHDPGRAHQLGPHWPPEQRWRHSGDRRRRPHPQALEPGIKVALLGFRVFTPVHLRDIMWPRELAWRGFGCTTTSPCDEKAWIACPPPGFMWPRALAPFQAHDPRPLTTRRHGLRRDGAHFGWLAMSMALRSTTRKGLRTVPWQACRKLWRHHLLLQW